MRLHSGARARNPHQLSAGLGDAILVKAVRTRPLFGPARRMLIPPWRRSMLPCSVLMQRWISGWVFRQAALQRHPVVHQFQVGLQHSPMFRCLLIAWCFHVIPKPGVPIAGDFSLGDGTTRKPVDHRNSLRGITMWIPRIQRMAARRRNISTTIRRPLRRR